MAATFEEFEDLLNGDQQIELGKLSSASQHGVPESVRAMVWSRLLKLEFQKNGTFPEEQTTTNAGLVSEDLEMNLYYIKKLRGELGRYCRQRPQLKTFQNRMEHIIISYLSADHQREYSSSLVSLCGPFLQVFPNELVAEAAFFQVMGMRGEMIELISRLLDGRSSTRGKDFQFCNSFPNDDT
jgi:hypothetical protein